MWQSGFLPNCSTICQLLELYNSFCQAMADGKEIRVVFLDISRAFDRVWHAGLIYKLKKAGISGKLLRWLKDYLKDRKQRVCLNGIYSEWGFILAGVPQGSVLGPLLFLIFINDITEVVLHTKIRLFADDTCLFVTVDNRDQTADLVNTDLQALQEWSNKWLVTFSPPKTQSLIISNKANIDRHPVIYLNNMVVTEVKEHKHLGIVFQRNLKWNSQINEMYVKSMKRLDILQAFKFKLNRSALERFYKSFVLPVLEYGDILWSGAQEYELNKLDSVQNRAMRIVTGATERSQINRLYEDLGWHSLSQRREIHQLKWLYKILHGSCPPYLVELVPPTVGERQRYNLRGAGNITPVPATSQIYYKSFFPSTIRLWNLLPLEIRNSPSLNSFTSNLTKLDTYKRCVVLPWHGFGNRFYNVHLTRIRLGCSKLKYHLHYNLHVEDSPMCNYCLDTEEDPYHYFFVCPRFNVYRRALFLSLQTYYPIPRLFNLLYGDINLTKHENENIITSIHTFMEDTNRFA